MSLSPAPSFVGKVIITTGKNDILHWAEDNGVVFNLSETLTAGEYWPDEFIVLVKAAMDAESLALGVSNVYTWAFSPLTGKFSLSESTLNGDFYLKAKLTDTTNILTGRSTDSAGNSFSIGQWGIDGIGWTFELAYLAGAASFTASQQMQNFWSPQDSPQNSDDGKSFASTGVQVRAIDGTIKTYDFSGWEDAESQFPLYGGKFRGRKLTFSFITTTKKDEWIHHFWGPYGKQGKLFKYYPDATLSANDENVLVGPRIQTHGMTDRLMGYTWWSGTIEMQRQ